MEMDDYIKTCLRELKYVKWNTNGWR